MAALCEELARRGHEVHLAARAGSAVAARAAPHVAAVHDVDPHGSFDPAAAVRLRGIVRDAAIGAVHCHSATLLRACYVARALTGGRLVYTPHHFRLRRHGFLYRRMMRRLDAVVAVSGSMRERIVARFRMDPARVPLVPNWADWDRFGRLPPAAEARAALGVSRPYAVGLIGSLVPVKGHEQFVRAAALLAARREDVEFVVVGVNRHAKGPFLGRLDRLRAKLGLGDRLRFLDWREDVRPVLAALTVLAVPSWHEAFSLVLVEAMAAGVPVVASASGGPAEIVADGVTGLHVPPRRVEPLAAAIARLLDDAPLRERLRARAREEVRRYALGPSVDALERLYAPVTDPALLESRVSVT